MIETSSKNSQIQNFTLYNIGGAPLLGYAPLLGIIRYTHIAALDTSALISPQKYYCFFIG